MLRRERSRFLEENFLMEGAEERERDGWRGAIFASPFNNIDGREGREEEGVDMRRERERERERERGREEENETHNCRGYTSTTVDIIEGLNQWLALYLSKWLVK